MGEQHPSFGPNFEHFIFNELSSYRDYIKPEMQINFWRTHDQTEVDFLLNESIAIEVKSSKFVSDGDWRGIVKLEEEMKLKKKIVISRDPLRRHVGGVDIYPWKDFLNALWQNEIL